MIANGKTTSFEAPDVKVWNFQGHKIHSNSQRIQNDQVEGLIMLAYVR